MEGKFFQPNSEIQMHGAKLPHWEQNDVYQFVTFRLNDSLPAEKLRGYRTERDQWESTHPEPRSLEENQEYHQLFSGRVAKWLDQGHGSCLFQIPENRDILSAVLMHDHPARVRFISWVIMPNHVHLLFQPKFPLEQLIRSWKGISARRIGQGSIWQSNYRDTLIRSERHFLKVVRYIRKNPNGLASGTFTIWESDIAQSLE